MLVKIDLHRVECKRVDRPHVVYVVDSLTMALERVLFLLRLRTRVEILHGDTTLN